MFRRVKAAGRDVWFHSDGFINDIAGDLAEIGVDVLNFQVAVTGHDWAARHVRGRIAVRTDIDRQAVLPFGSPSQVREEVARTFESCGTADGGIIACGEIGPDVPLANIRALYEAFRNWGAGRPDPARFYFWFRQESRELPGLGCKGGVYSGPLGQIPGQRKFPRVVESRRGIEIRRGPGQTRRFDLRFLPEPGASPCVRPPCPPFRSGQPSETRSFSSCS